MVSGGHRCNNLSEKLPRVTLLKECSRAMRVNTWQTWTGPQRVHTLQREERLKSTNSLTMYYFKLSDIVNNRSIPKNALYLRRNFQCRIWTVKATPWLFYGSQTLTLFSSSNKTTKNLSQTDIKKKEITVSSNLTSHKTGCSFLWYVSVCGKATCSCDPVLPNGSCTHAWHRTHWSREHVFSLGTAVLRQKTT
jgi:hypothetical protein